MSQTNDTQTQNIRYNGTEISIEGGRVTKRGWDPRVAPFRVTFYVSDSSPGLFGWRSMSDTFTTLDQALLVAAMKMPRGFMSVSVDVARNRANWNKTLPPVPGGDPYGERAPDAGFWEPVGKRKAGKAWKWSKGWSQARASKVAAHQETKAAEFQAWLKARESIG